MAARGVRFERHGAVGKIVLERPEVANAFDLPAALSLGAAVTEAAATEVRAVTLTGEGKRFCAGGDVSSFLAADDPGSYLHELVTELEAPLRRLSELRKPVVAGVQGAVAGAGLAFILNADLVIAAEGTKFVFAYPGIGMTPDCGVSWLLPRVVGQQRALDFAISGRTLLADQAREWGLVTEVVTADQLAARTDEVAAALAEGPALAFGEAKRLIRGSWESSRVDSAADELATIKRMVASDDAQRLIQRFLDR